jgi:SAM-dependent methyltransferase
VPVAYDKIGATYSKHRRSDPRIAAAIDAAIGDAEAVVNVGAGTGSYEPRRERVVAVEPSAVMIAQRAPSATFVARAVAESLPFRDRAFDAAFAVLTIHHWPDWRRGFRECARVAGRRVVVFTWDPDSGGFWLWQEYFRDLLAQDRIRFPRVAEMESVLGELEVRPVPIPSDCADGFLGAYWQRPTAYLDPFVRDGMSSFADGKDVSRQLSSLEADLASGLWAERHADLLDRRELDIGYRLLIAEIGA